METNCQPNKEYVVHHKIWVHFGDIYQGGESFDQEKIEDLR